MRGPSQTSKKFLGTADLNETKAMGGMTRRLGCAINPQNLCMKTPEKSAQRKSFTLVREREKKEV